VIKSEAAALFRAEAARRILVTDGAFGTMVQTYGLGEAEYRGSIDTGHDQKGNNDLLSLTRPDIVREITDAYLAAGSDIACTNTFNANKISQGDYGAEHLVRDLNIASATIAREAADAAFKANGVPRFVAGDARGAGADRARIAADDQLHHDRPHRAQPVGAFDRELLGERAPCAAADDRGQLLVRRA